MSNFEKSLNELERLNHKLVEDIQTLKGNLVTPNSTNHYQKGSIVQLNPDKVQNKAFAGCFLTVTEAKSWGVQGYVQSLGTRDEAGGQAYYRANFDEIEFCGMAVWMID